jgi:hypothetical protein
MTKLRSFVFDGFEGVSSTCRVGKKIRLFGNITYSKNYSAIGFLTCFRFIVTIATKTKAKK